MVLVVEHALHTYWKLNEDSSGYKRSCSTQRFHLNTDARHWFRDCDSAQDVTMLSHWIHCYWLLVHPARELVAEQCGTVKHQLLGTSMSAPNFHRAVHPFQVDSHSAIQVFILQVILTARLFFVNQMNSNLERMAKMACEKRGVPYFTTAQRVWVLTNRAILIPISRWYLF